MSWRGRGSNIKRTGPVTRSKGLLTSKSVNNSKNTGHIPDLSMDNEGATGGIPSTLNPPVSDNTVIQEEIRRAEAGLNQIQTDSRKNAELNHSVSTEQIQNMIDKSIEAQTERLTSLFNKVLVEQLSSFKTPPSSLGFPQQNPRRTTFNRDNNYELHFPRQQVFSNLNTSDQIDPFDRSPSFNNSLNFGHRPREEEIDRRIPQQAQGLNNPSAQSNGNRNSNSNLNVPLENNNRSPQRNLPNIARFVPSENQQSNNIPQGRGPPNYPPNADIHASNDLLNSLSNIFNNTPNAFHSSKNGLNNWDLKYDGKSSVLRFIMKIDVIRKSNNLPWAYVVGNFHNLLKRPSSADRWYWSWVYSKHIERVDITWELLREALISRFSSAQTDEDITRLLNDKRQKPSEKFDEFFEDFMVIHDGLTVPKSDIELIAILKRNVNNKLFNLTYNLQATNVDSFRVMVQRIETDLDRRYQAYPFSFQRNKEYKKVNEINTEFENEEEDASDDIQVDEIRVSGQGYRDNNTSRNKRTSSK